jgi:Periplasmic serine proteases (ClpP class)
MEFLTEYGLFLAKTLTVVGALVVVVGGMMALSAWSRAKAEDHIEVKHLNRKYENMTLMLQAVILPQKAFKHVLKAKKQERKAEQKKSKAADLEMRKRRVFVLNFRGDIRASALASLRNEITAVLTVATPQDEVVVRLESAGGMVHAYGLAASQLARIKNKKIPLTVATDKVAASGGYMMACVADRILAAPFAVLGSIGVLVQMPNFHRYLKKNDIDFEQFTAGEYKRTITLFAENTDQDRQKLKEEIEDIHLLFKDFIKQHRPDLDIAKVATGEHWLGTRALQLKLVDELCTSDDYLLEASKTADLYEVTHVSKKKLAARFFSFANKALEHHLLPRLPHAGEERML